MKTNYEVAQAFVAKKNNVKGPNCSTGWSGVFFSYSTNIAVIANGVVLVADRYPIHSYFYDGYGRTKTTERHKLNIKRAALDAGVKVFEVVNIDCTKEGHNENIKAMKSEVKALKKKAERAREYGAYYLIAVEQKKAEIKAYKAIFHI